MTAPPLASEEKAKETTAIPMSEEYVLGVAAQKKGKFCGRLLRCVALSFCSAVVFISVMYVFGLVTDSTSSDRTNTQSAASQPVQSSLTSVQTNSLDQSDSDIDDSRWTEDINRIASSLENIESDVKAMNIRSRVLDSDKRRSYQDSRADSQMTSELPRGLAIMIGVQHPFTALSSMHPMSNNRRYNQIRREVKAFLAGEQSLKFLFSENIDLISAIRKSETLLETYQQLKYTPLFRKAMTLVLLMLTKVQQQLKEFGVPAPEATLRALEDFIYEPSDDNLMILYQTGLDEVNAISEHIESNPEQLYNLVQDRFEEFRQPLSEVLLENSELIQSAAASFSKAEVLMAQSVLPQLQTMLPAILNMFQTSKINSDIARVANDAEAVEEELEKDIVTLFRDFISKQEIKLISRKFFPLLNLAQDIVDNVMAESPNLRLEVWRDMSWYPKDVEMLSAETKAELLAFPRQVTELARNEVSLIRNALFEFISQDDVIPSLLSKLNRVKNDLNRLASDVDDEITGTHEEHSDTDNAIPRLLHDVVTSGSVKSIMNSISQVVSGVENDAEMNGDPYLGESFDDGEAPKVSMNKNSDQKELSDTEFLETLMKENTFNEDNFEVDMKKEEEALKQLEEIVEGGPEKTVELMTDLTFVRPVEGGQSQLVDSGERPTELVD